MSEWRTTVEGEQGLYPDGRFQQSSRTANITTDVAEHRNVASDEVEEEAPEAKDYLSFSSKAGWFVRLGPCRGNLFEWHFTIAGPAGSVFEGGLYHGRILLPANYPSRAPRVQFLNANGRFQTKTDICLSASNFHQETWQPSWTVRTLVTALAAHMLTPAREIGGVETTEAVKRALAKSSRHFHCKACGADHTMVDARGAVCAEVLPSQVTTVTPRQVVRARGEVNMLVKVLSSRVVVATLLLVLLLQLLFA